MAVNQSRSMNDDFYQGGIDSTYMQLTPDRGNVENPPFARMTWPTYRQVEEHEDPPFVEAHVRRSVLPREARANDSDFASGADPRY